MSLARGLILKSTRTAELLAHTLLIAFCLALPAEGAMLTRLMDADDLRAGGLRDSAGQPLLSSRKEGHLAEAAPVGSANPLWGVPLSALQITRDRPLFSPSRRPPAPIVASAPVVVESPPPPPKPPERANLSLLGTVVGQGERIALLFDELSHETIRLRIGEKHRDWILNSVERSVAAVRKGAQTEKLEFLPSMRAGGQPPDPPATAASRLPSGAPSTEGNSSGPLETAVSRPSGVNMAASPPATPSGTITAPGGSVLTPVRGAKPIQIDIPPVIVPSAVPITQGQHR